jgi:TMEM175 potassium channel family protein
VTTAATSAIVAERGGYQDDAVVEPLRKPLTSDPLLDLKTTRIEALSDGVFAIAMTILVLNITVPTAATVPADRLIAALRNMAPQVIVYIVTFINLGVLWVGHHNQYHFIARADRWFLWLNILYLLLISFMPLSTALLGHYPLHRVALVVYGVNLIAATLVLAAHWHYATTTGRLARDTLAPAVVRLAHRRILGSVGAYTVALLLSLVVPVVAFALFLAVPLLNVFPFTLDRYFRASSKE